MSRHCVSHIPTESKVTRPTLLQIDLESVAGEADVLSHHYWEMKTGDGHAFTVEKDTSWSSPVCRVNGLVSHYALAIEG